MMKIGALSLSTGTPVETIRFYEREGLLPAPARTGGNFRIYEGRHVERLAFIRHCRSLDMTLSEIRLLLGARDEPQRSCADVNLLLDSHIERIAARIEELRTLGDQLAALRRQCGESRNGSDCGILNGLEAASTAAVRRSPPDV